MLKLVAGAIALAAAEGGGGGILSVDSTLVWGTLVVFALFAFILGKFAWGPLLKIVDEREKTIREQVDSAQLAAAEAKDLLVQHQELLRGAGLTIIGGAAGIGRLAAAAMEGIARQPNAAGDIRGAMIVAAGLIEGVTFFSLIVTILLAIK